METSLSSLKFTLRCDSREVPRVPQKLKCETRAETRFAPKNSVRNLGKSETRTQFWVSGPKENLGSVSKRACTFLDRWRLPRPAQLGTYDGHLSDKQTQTRTIRQSAQSSRLSKQNKCLKRFKWRPSLLQSLGRPGSSTALPTATYVSHFIGMNIGLSSYESAS